METSFRLPAEGAGWVIFICNSYTFSLFHHYCIFLLPRTSYVFFIATMLFTTFLIIRRTRQKERHGKTGRSRDVWRGAGRERGAICYSALKVNHIFYYASRPEMAGKTAEIHLVDRRVWDLSNSFEICVYWQFASCVSTNPLPLVTFYSHYYLGLPPRQVGCGW